MLISNDEENLLYVFLFFYDDTFFEVNTDMNYVEAENYPKEVIGPLWKVP